MPQFPYLAESGMSVSNPLVYLMRLLPKFLLWEEI